MPRKKNDRIVYEPPRFTEFKPIGVPVRELESVLLSLDEFEAVRLADFTGLSHEEASDEMKISRSTFSRLIVKARKKIATFLLQGMILKVEGGHVHFKNNVLRCMDCGYMFRITFDSPIDQCPECHSKNLLSLAGGFGHGKCCTDSKFNKNNKGGRNV